MTLPLKVAWTLVYEMRFYMIFVLLLLFGKPGLWAFALWGAVILVSFFAGIEVPDVLSLWNLYFLLGMVGFLLLDRIPPRSGIAIFGLGILLCVIYGVLGVDVQRIAHLGNAPWLHLILAPAFFCLILGAVLSERAYAIRYPALLKLLGDASYSIYLVHSAAISAIVLIGRKLGLIEAMGVHTFFLCAFVAAVTAGTVAYLVVEKPLVGLCKRLL